MERFYWIVAGCSQKWKNLKHESFFLAKEIYLKVFCVLVKPLKNWLQNECTSMNFWIHIFLLHFLNCKYDWQLKRFAPKRLNWTNPLRCFKKNVSYLQKYCVVMNYSKSHSCPAFGQNFALLDVRDKLTNDQKMSTAEIALF